MKPPRFDYHAPESIEEAVEMLAAFGEDAKVLAGGQSLIPLLALRLTSYEHLIDLGRIEAIKGIEQRDGSLWLGAGTTDAVVGSSPEVAAKIPLLFRATPLIGHFQIRNRGTIGGSIAHADPAAEYPAVALALDAELEVESPRGRRVVAAADFFHGMWTTDLAPDEILVGVRFPIRTGRWGFAIREVARRHGDFAIAGAAVGVELDDDDRVTQCCLGLIGLASTPVRPRWAESQVTGRHVEEINPRELGELAMSQLESIPSDLHGSAEYRRHVGAVMVSRAWRSACEEAARV